MKRFARIAAIAGKGVLVALLALLLAYDGYILIARACGVRAPTVFGFATAAVAIVLLVVNLGFRKHDPADLWVNQMKGSGRRVALVYPEGDPAAQKWLKAQSRRLKQEFARVETYALPAGAPAEERDGLLADLRERENLDEVLQPKEK